jgi:urease alpha subunit
MKNKMMFNAIAMLILIVAAFFAGRNSAPVKIEEKIKVEKQIDTVTVVKEIKRPDGTIEKETTQVDKSTIKANKDTLIVTERPKNKVNLGLGYDIKEKRQVYIGSYERRLFSNIWVGATATSSGTVGLTVGLEF